MAAERRVVITGMGVVSPIGNSIGEFLNSLKTGKSGIGLITKFDASEYKTKIAGEVKNFDPEKVIDLKEIRRIDLFTQYALYSAAEAVENSGLDFDKEDPFRIGSILGSGIGGINVLEQQVETYLTKGFGRVSPFYITGMISNICAGHISMKYGIMGPNYVTSSACASSNHAISDAYYAIVRGDADVILTGGAEGAVSPTSIAGFINIQALSRRNDEPEKASRPFDKDRDGFIMGEGGGVIVLEELEHAKKRGAEIIAEFAGAGMSADGYHITAPHPDGIGAAKAMELAISHAGMNLQDVNYINCHGTSTPAGDIAETKSIKKAFGDLAYQLNISSTKSIHGHLLGAAGAIECIATTLAVKNDFIPPTMNVENQDPECDLNCTPNSAIDKEINFALSNSFGFGGQNATIAIKKFK